MHIDSTDLVVFIGCIIIDPLCDITAGSIKRNLIFSVGDFAASALLIHGTENVKELAYAFINYMIGEDVQYEWASTGGPAPANQTAAEKIDPEYAASCAMDEESLNRLYFMEYRTEDVKREWSDLWIEVKGA